MWHILEADFDLWLVNAAHAHNVPGRKTDVNDAQWLADLLAHGLLRKSFVPPPEIDAMRQLTRARKQFVRERGQHLQRIQKTLEDCNIKLTGLITDLLGDSGRAILKALIEGQTDPEQLAGLLKGRLQAKRGQVREALRGCVRSHHRLLLKTFLEQIESLDQGIDALDEEVGECLKPFQHAAQIIKSMPGIGEVSAQVIIAEIGVDMGRFPSAGHLKSWAGMCPVNDESAGKRRSTRLRKGAPWLKVMLVQSAWAAVRKKDSYFNALYLRVKGRRGTKKAIMAVAASMLTAIYHMLKTGTEYQERGGQSFDELDRERTTRRLTKRLEALGYQVDLKAAA